VRNLSPNNAEEDLIKNFLIEVMPMQSEKIIEDAKKAILDFEVSTKLVKENKVIGLITPPAHS